MQATLSGRKETDYSCVMQLEYTYIKKIMFRTCDNDLGNMSTNFKLDCVINNYDNMKK